MKPSKESERTHECIQTVEQCSCSTHVRKVCYLCRKVMGPWTEIGKVKVQP